MLVGQTVFEFLPHSSFLIHPVNNALQVSAYIEGKNNFAK
jgi:hypothetical protein